MEFLDLITPALTNSIKNLDGSRFIESLFLLYIAWRQVKKGMAAHLTKIENSLNKLADAVEKGFKTGEERFESIESELENHEKRIGKLEELNPANAVN